MKEQGKVEELGGKGLSGGKMGMREVNMGGEERWRKKGREYGENDGKMREGGGGKIKKRKGRRKDRKLRKKRQINKENRKKEKDRKVRLKR